MAGTDTAGPSTARWEGTVAVRASRTPLVGREPEIRRVTDVLRTDGVRLVTITGPSGVGKTVLAEEVARVIVSTDPVGVEELPVGGRSGPTGLGSIAHALAGRPPERSTATDAPPTGRTRVLLLDGAEAAPGVDLVVADALDAHADLTVLVTSVTPLSLRGERVIRLAPLACPAGDEDDPDRALSFPAVELFTTMASAADSTFELTTPTTPVVVELCRTLEGLPLALELAARRCGTEPVETVLDRIRSSSALDVLTDGAVDAQQHHRNLRAAVRWSHDLLGAEAQRCFRRLGVLAGPFDAATAAAIAGDGAANTSVHPTSDVCPTLSELIAAGLLESPADHGPGDLGDGRVRMPAPVRAMALELLDEHSETVPTIERHTAHHEQLAHALAGLQRAPDGHLAEQDMVAAAPDMIAAVDHLRAQGHARRLLQLVVDLGAMWISTGQAALGERLLTPALDAFEPGAGAADRELLARAWACSAELALRCNAPTVPDDAVTARIERALELVADLDDRDLVAQVHETALEHLILTGRLNEAADTVGTALEAYGPEGYRRGRLLSLAAVVENQRGDSDAALSFAEESRAVVLANGDRRQLLYTSLVLLGIPGSPEQDASTPDVTTDLVQLAREIGEHQVEGFLLAGQATRTALLGDLTGAAGQLTACLTVGRRHGYWYVEEFGVMSLAGVAALAGRDDAALRLHGALQPLMSHLRHRVPPAGLAVFEGVVASARERLGQDGADAAAAVGGAMAWREVLRFSTDLIDDLGAPGDGGQGDGGQGEPTLPGHAASGTPPPPLTARETDVLVLLTQGCSNKEIAALLGMRPKTVGHHTSAIYRKLGVRSRTAAAAMALQQGWLPQR